MTELLPVRTPSLYRFMTSTMASYSCICDDVLGTLTAVADWLIGEMLLFRCFRTQVRISESRDQINPENPYFDFRRMVSRSGIRSTRVSAQKVAARLPI